MGEGIWTLLRDHAIQVDLDDLALEDAEVALGPYVLTNADDADRGVVDRELLVLLERLPESVQAVADEFLQCACDYTRSVSIRVGSGGEARVGGAHSLRSSRSASRGRFSRFATARQWTWRSTRRNFLMARTRRGGGLACPVRSRAIRHRTDGDRTPGCSLGPLFKCDGVGHRDPRDIVAYGRTIGNGGNESVHRRGAVEEHAGRHSLLSHEVTGETGLEDGSSKHNDPIRTSIHARRRLGPRSQYRHGHLFGTSSAGTTRARRTNASSHATSEQSCAPT